MKTFTLDEAQALLPVLESLLKRAIEAKQAAESLQEELQELSRRIFLSGGMRVNVADVRRRKAALDGLVQRAKDAVSEIDAIGVQVKDLETGLLDFPARLDGEVVLLCWKMGEERITHWHTLEAGFRGRQPIGDRFGRVRPDKPN
ncbi:DUF2203 domain-containing protein [Paracidobacterium acidisoli]|uniref:DUF2203 family protein n=1 Tax=Paracidobacterium acidisoli TaxID=2303751 RepID=A0A372IKH6_9BACT|nr:DUF2203 domain-containing protein [Paracidobacterium acidisoli]MBT9332844.1 DUF2203 domain-containing protein [Paracidobacterium acidisoli]